MPNKILALALGSVVTLAACTDTAYEPIVTSFNESSVGIQIQQSTFAVMTEEAQAQAIDMADAKAQDICSRGPNRRAERTSSRQVPAGEYMIATEYLYLCLK